MSQKLINHTKRWKYQKNYKKCHKIQPYKKNGRKELTNISNLKFRIQMKNVVAGCPQGGVDPVVRWIPEGEIPYPAVLAVTAGVRILKFPGALFGYDHSD